jgi:hypothetical protein
MRMRGLTLVEVLVIVVALAMLVALVLPVFARARRGSQKQQCAQTLRSLLSAMWMYSDSPGSNGYLPTYISPGGTSENADAMGSLGLLYRQFVNDPRIFICPSDPTKPTLKIMSSLPAMPVNGTVPVAPMKPVDSSYAYNPGHHEDDRVLLISDKKGAGANSNNHGSNNGQNVGFGTSVKYSGPGFAVEGGKFDPDIFARNAELKFAEDSFLRQ